MHRYGQGEKEVSSLALDTQHKFNAVKTNKKPRGVSHRGPCVGTASVNMGEKAHPCSKNGEGIDSNFAWGSRGIGICDGSQLEGHGERCSGER